MLKLLTVNLLDYFLCLPFILVVNNCLNELVVFIKHLSHIHTHAQLHITIAYFAITN